MWGRRSFCVVCPAPRTGPRPLLLGIHQIRRLPGCSPHRQSFSVAPALERIQWSYDSSCQNGIPVRPRMRLASRPVLPLSHRITSGNAAFGGKTTWTWFGMTTHALREWKPRSRLRVLERILDDAGDAAGVTQPKVREAGQSPSYENHGVIRDPMKTKSSAITEHCPGATFGRPQKTMV